MKHHDTKRRLVVYCALLPMLMLGLTVPLTAGESNDETVLEAADGTTVIIRRDEYGVPHIRARTETGAFFGQGFAVAEDRLFQMEIFRRISLGRLAEIDPTQLATDIQVRTVFYTAAEREELFQALPPPVRNMMTSFAQGVNEYLDRMAEDPLRYKPIQFAVVPDPTAWTHDDVVAIMQFFMRRFGQYGGQELTRLVELMTLGDAWFEANRPINDPGAPTTISGTVAPETETRVNLTRIDVDLDVARRVESQLRAFVELVNKAGVPPSLGSFAALISSRKSASRNVMLFGGPQLGEPTRIDEVSRAWEVELISPTLHVGGMTIPGIPGVVIGRTEAHAWSLTSGNTDNTDTYIELTDPTLTSYLYNGDFVPFDITQETIYQGATPIPFTRLRSVHGPVVGADLASQQAFTWKMTFWGQELEMATAFYRLWKARGLRQFEDVVATIPMSFNIFYSGVDQRVKYWHVGKFQNRLDGVDPRLPHIGDGSQEWDGFLSFDELPKASDKTQSYFVNWNNKPAPWWNNGDNVAWALVDDRLDRTTRVTRINDYIGPIVPMTYEELQGLPPAIDTLGTYQQVIEFAREVRAENTLPPGESGFVSLLGVPDTHMFDQWPLQLSFGYKKMRFARSAGGVLGSESIATSTAGPSPDLTGELVGYPNPATSELTLEFTIPAAGAMEVQLYDILGRQVRIRRLDVNRGRHAVVFKVDDLPAGLYLARVQHALGSKDRQIIVAR